MRRPLFPVLLLVCSAGCGSAPEAKYPSLGTLPVKPMPEDDGASEPAPAPEPKPAAPSPVDAALPAAPPTMLAHAYACKDKECRLPKFLPDPKLEKADPSGADSPGALWLEDVAAGSTLIVPRHSGLELVGVVLAGDGLASGDEGGAPAKLGVWSAFRAAGGGLNVKAGASGCKLVLGLAATKGTLAEALTHAEKKAFEVRWKKRPSPVASIALAGAKDLAWAGGAFHVRIAYGGEPPVTASLESMLASPTAAVKEHDHAGAWEHIAVLSGAGTMKLAGKDYEVKAGSVFDIAPATLHSLTLSGSTPLLAIQMYTPSGPEQRFVKLAEDATKPPAEPKK